MKKPPKNIPSSPGVYFFKKVGGIIYIGKAKNLKDRISSYFSKQNIDLRKIDMTNEATTVIWQETESDAEALIREAELIKKYKPKYNILMRDDKQYFYVGFSIDEFPRIFLTHQPGNTEIKNLKLKIKNLHYIGPFTDGASLKQTLKMLRRAFPYCTCREKHKRRCQSASIGKCLGICCLNLNSQITSTKSQTPIPSADGGVTGQANSKFKILNSKKFKERVVQYKKNIRLIKNVLSGKGKKIIVSLEKEMKTLSQKQQYEKAALARDQLYALQNVFSHHHMIRREEEGYAHKGLRYLADILHLLHTPKRIEAYDISNIQGKYATGAMVVFTDGKPDTNEYRKFNIRLPARPNDTAMIREIISRRFTHPEWGNPDVIVIDGGKAQRSVAEHALRNFQFPIFNFQSISNNQIFKKTEKIKIVALAKREEELYLPDENIIKLKEGPPALLHLLQYIRNEAHRFAIQHHRKRRSALLKTSYQ